MMSAKPAAIAADPDDFVAVFFGVIEVTLFGLIFTPAFLHVDR